MDLVVYTGLCLKAARKRQGLTQQQVAEEMCLLTGGINYNKSRVSDIERGQINISLQTLQSLMMALHMAPHQFFDPHGMTLENLNQGGLLVDNLIKEIQNRPLHEITFLTKFIHDLDELKKRNPAEINTTKVYS